MEHERSLERQVEDEREDCSVTMFEEMKSIPADVLDIKSWGNVNHVIIKTRDVFLFCDINLVHHCGVRALTRSKVHRGSRKRAFIESTATFERNLKTKSEWPVSFEMLKLESKAKTKTTGDRSRGWPPALNVPFDYTPPCRPISPVVYATLFEQKG